MHFALLHCDIRPHARYELNFLELKHTESTASSEPSPEELEKRKEVIAYILSQPPLKSAEGMLLANLGTAVRDKFGAGYFHRAFYELLGERRIETVRHSRNYRLTQQY